VGKRIFVRNLSFGSTDEGLRAHFEQAGHEVRSARVVLDRETGKSRGFGFVELVDDAHVDAAIGALDGSFMDGRPISVREAHDQKAGGGPGGPRGPRSFDGPPRGPRSFDGPPRGPRSFDGPPRGPRGEGGPPRREGGFEGGPGGFRGRPPRDGGAPPRPEGDFRPRPPREGFGGGGPGGFPPPPPGEATGERRRPPQKKKKKFRSDEEDRGAVRDGEDRKARRQRKHMRGGLDGDYEDW
jgi:RNA recognition motif-containing protein